MKQFALRFEDENRLAQLTAWADREKRSTHAQIMLILEQALAQEEATVAAGAARNGTHGKDTRTGRR